MHKQEVFMRIHQKKTVPQGTVPEQTMPSSGEDAACGGAASVEIGTECDCEMHGSCLC